MSERCFAYKRKLGKSLFYSTLLFAVSMLTYKRIDHFTGFRECDKVKIAIYSRKSLFTGKGESVENQIEMCKEYINFSLNNEAPKEIFVYEDEGFSAKNLNRPQFQKMMHDLEAEHFDYIVCYRLDRLSRNVSDFSGLIETLERKNVHLICIKEHFDTSSPMGRAMMYITSVFAQLERETLAERVRDNMHMLARTGRWLGGTAPTGFDTSELSEIIMDGKMKTSHALVFNDEIETVKLIVKTFLENPSVSGVNKKLIRENIKSRSSGKFFSIPGIREILSNPVYCIADSDAYEYFYAHNADICRNKKEWNGSFGVTAYNKRDYSKGAKRNDISDWIISIGQHQGIVSGKDWVFIQNYFHDNSNEKIINTSELGLLSGLIYCTECGEKMFTKKRSNDPNNYSYICSSKLKGGMALCGCKNLLGKQTDDIVVDFIRNKLDGFDLYGELKSKINEYECGDNQKKIKSAEQSIKALDAEIDVLTQRLADSSLSAVAIQAVDRKLNEKVAEKEKIQQDLTALMQNHEHQIIDTYAIVSALQSFSNEFDHLSIFDKRQIIQLLIDRIEWDGENLDIFMYGE